MTKASRWENIGFHLAGYGVLVTVAVVALLNAPSAGMRWLQAAILLTFGILQARVPDETKPVGHAHLYLGVQGTLVALLILLQPGWTMFPMLYFPLSVQAILLLSFIPGIFWIALYSAISVGSIALSQGWQAGLLALFAYGGGYLFFGSFAHALVRAEKARRESQELLAELQEAHGQLQEYARRVEELAVVQERNRLAREMHDTLGHRLTVAAVQLEGAQRLCAQDQERAAQMVSTVRDQVREALAELRSTVATLRTPIEADLQVRSSLQRLVGDFEQATGLTVHRVLPDSLPDLPAAHRLALYRAAQEALTNVQRHAQASQVWLVLNISPNDITLIVGDDGQGLTFEAGKTGVGLLGLRERAELLGGHLHLEPRRGGGAQFSFHLPLPKTEVGFAPGDEGNGNG